MDYINTYSGIKKYQPFSLRSKGRKGVLDILGLLGNFKPDTPYKTKRIQFLYIHHLFTDEEIKLRTLLDFLSKHHLFTSYSDAVNRVLTNRIDNSYICFSSDDGLKNNMRLAKILDEYAIKACFFICPSITGEKDFNKIKSFCREKIGFPPVEFLDWKDVDILLKSGHEIGSHTMTHINVANTPLDIAEEELSESYKTVKDHCGVSDHFAYPYGKYFHFNEQGREMVFNIGYSSCASAERGCHVLQDMPLQKENLLIRRDHIIVDWKLDHIKYFLRRNAMHSKLQQNNFPFSVS